VLSGPYCASCGQRAVELALKRVFGDSWPKTILESAAVASAYLVGVFAASLLVLAIALASV